MYTEISVYSPMGVALPATPFFCGRGFFFKREAWFPLMGVVSCAILILTLSSARISVAEKWLLRFFVSWLLFLFLFLMVREWGPVGRPVHLFPSD